MAADGGGRLRVSLPIPRNPTGATVLSIHSTVLAVAFSTATLLGQSASQPAGLQPGEQYRLLVVTDAARDGTSANIGDYDQFVTADINAVPALAALHTNWHALASTPTVNVRDHTDTWTGGVPIYRRDGVRVFDDYTHMWSTVSTPPLAAPNLTSSGVPTAIDRAWTGTYVDGTTNGPLGGSGNARAGAPDQVVYWWVWANDFPQTVAFPLYAISDVLTVPYPQYPADLRPGDRFRVLFVTNATRDGTSANIGDYDAFVTADAQAVPAMARFVTNWRALASTVAASADVHTGTQGGGGVPIYRPDGVRVFHDYTHLWNSSSTPPLAPPNIASSGLPTTASYVWTGTAPWGHANGGLGNGISCSSGAPTGPGYGWIYANHGFYPPQQLPLYGISDEITVPEPRHPADLQPGQQYRVLLVTDATRTGNSPHIADYNTFVTADAQSQPAMRLLATQWHAVASTATVDARDNTGTSGGGGVPIYRPDGVRVFHDHAHMWNALSTPALAAPDITSSGISTPIHSVWTGSLSDGTSYFPLGSSASFAGQPDQLDAHWVFGPITPTTTPLPLYAISGILTVQFPPTIGTGCGAATLRRDTLPSLGASLDCTLGGVPAGGIGAVLVDLDVPGPGVLQPTPPFATGCHLYLNHTLTLGLALAASRRFTIAIPNNPAYVGLPFTLQGATLDPSIGVVEVTNAIAAFVGY